MDYRARFYSPRLGRFIQPDTIVPDSGNQQNLNRFAYANNNPVLFNDPSGHSGQMPPNPFANVNIYVPVPFDLVVGAFCFTFNIFLPIVPVHFEPIDYGGGYLVGDSPEKWTKQRTTYVLIVPDVIPVYPTIAINPDDFVVKISREPQALKKGNDFHYGKGGGQDQLKEQYPDTEFIFKKRGQKGADVEVELKTKHPSEYPNSSWDPDNKYGDFKTNQPWSEYKFNREIEIGKLPKNTQPLPYDPKSRKLLPVHKFGPF